MCWSIVFRRRIEVKTATVSRARIHAQAIEPLPVLLRHDIGIRLSKLITKVPILATKALALLLQRLNIAILFRQQVLQLANLARPARLNEALGVFAFGGGVTFVALDFLFETEHVEDHDVGAVEDQREEEREAAEVHVALGVEFARLHFHAFGAADGRGTGVFLAIAIRLFLKWNVPCCTALLFGSRELYLHPVDPIDAVNEQNQYEYEGDLPLIREYSCMSNGVEPTFMPYCNLATSGLSEMKVKSLRLQV